MAVRVKNDERNVVMWRERAERGVVAGEEVEGSSMDMLGRWGHGGPDCGV